MKLRQAKKVRKRARERIGRRPYRAITWFRADKVWRNHGKELFFPTYVVRKIEDWKE